ncbi:pollen-specific leucine-rich repeat extensin-like protein 4 [Phthorimaea operculella]|nr:pollen-specific leucine-rich repeat extensin-like protein 4 [Phthorimaea operculella]
MGIRWPDHSSRALLDTGAQGCIVSSKLVSRLGLNVQPSEEEAVGIGGLNVPDIRGQTNFEFTLGSTCTGVSYQVSAVVLDEVVGNSSVWRPQDLPEGDTVIYGSVLSEVLQRFWESEEPPTADRRKPEDDECELFYQYNTARCPSGRFEWPFNECRAPLGPPDRGLRVNVRQLVPKPNPAFLLERYGSLDKLLGVTGWIKRFVNNCRKPQAERNFTPVLSPAERNAALCSLVRVVQAEHFEEEWRCAASRDVGGGGGEMSGVVLPHAPLSAAEALSSLLWQPYECRSPPLARSRTDGALVLAGGGAGGPLTAAAPARAPAQSPNGGRHACASYRATTPRHEMRLPVPAPAPLRKSDSVSVRVPGEPSRQNVSSVNIVQVQDAPSCNVNSAVQTERERSVVSAECQTEEPRRRRARRPRAPRQKRPIKPNNFCFGVTSVSPKVYLYSGWCTWWFTLGQVLQTFDVFLPAEASHQAEQLLLCSHVYISYSLPVELVVHLAVCSRYSKPSMSVRQQKRLIKLNNFCFGIISCIFYRYFSWAPVGVPGGLHQLLQTFDVYCAGEVSHQAEQLLLWNHILYLL